MSHLWNQIWNQGRHHDKKIRQTKSGYTWPKVNLYQDRDGKPVFCHLAKIPVTSLNII